MVGKRSMMGSERQVIKEEDHRIDPVEAMLKMKRELENLKKKKNVEEMNALMVDNSEMKQKLEIGRTPIVNEEHRNHKDSNARTVTRMEGENSSYHHATNRICLSLHSVVVKKAPFHVRDHGGITPKHMEKSNNGQV